MPHSYCKRCKAIKRKASQNNLTFAFVEALYKHQEDRCAICGSTNGEPGSGSDWLQMDHWGGCCERSSKDDKTCGKCVRGLLCGACNSRLLSWYEQAPDHLRTIAAVNEYLTNWPAQAVRQGGVG
ncbi:endonuclease domain-containing protein [Streptomyces malaysiensis]|uniref:endonuclease domain-containing protein n=1 Tax=Streptomyces malaysiensis TaxID=92644 RepID=UPI003D2F6607|nr:endonuclease VII domain-containing protein [Streptomyces malaysiensis]